MHIVSTGENFHEVSKPILLKKKKVRKYFKMSSVEIFTQSAKR